VPSTFHNYTAVLCSDHGQDLPSGQAFRSHKAWYSAGSRNCKQILPPRKISTELLHWVDEKVRLLGERGSLSVNKLGSNGQVSISGPGVSQSLTHSACQTQKAAQVFKHLILAKFSFGNRNLGTCVNGGLKGGTMSCHYNCRILNLGNESSGRN
jgi:hypothetical protein